MLTSWVEFRDVEGLTVLVRAGEVAAIRPAPGKEDEAELHLRSGVRLNIEWGGTVGELAAKLQRYCVPSSE